MKDERKDNGQDDLPRHIERREEREEEQAPQEDRAELGGKRHLEPLDDRPIGLLGELFAHGANSNRQNTRSACADQLCGLLLQPILQRLASAPRGRSIFAVGWHLGPDT